MIQGERGVSEYSIGFQKYMKVVAGSVRSRHTYLRRLDTIDELSGGIKGKKVLDIGCGYGFRTIGIAKRGASFVIGIDTDGERIREGKLFAKKYELDNVQYHVRDATHTEYKDESFDIVIADEMIHHVDDLPALMKEIHRILRRAGIVVISDHNRLSLPSEILRTIHFGKEKQKVFTAKEIEHLLKNANFSSVLYKHIIMTLPLHNIPKFILTLNNYAEAIIERTPLLRLQCGVYVIRGMKI